MHNWSFLICLHFCWSGSSSSPAFTCALIPANITSHTTSTSLLSPLTLSLRIQEGHLHSICQLSHLLLGLLLLNSNEKVMKASSALYFWDHHTPVQIVVKPWTLQLYIYPGTHMHEVGLSNWVCSSVVCPVKSHNRDVKSSFVMDINIWVVTITITVNH